MPLITGEIGFGFVGCDHRFELEIPAEEWAEMTPDERDKEITAFVEQEVWNHIDWSYRVEE